MLIFFCVLIFLLFIDVAYNAYVWQVYEENWAWVHKCHRFTGDVKHIQKVKGVPMMPPKRTVTQKPSRPIR